MAKKPSKSTTPQGVTFDAAGSTYVAFMGTAALIQLERAFEVPLKEMKNRLQNPDLSTVRDLFAAVLIEHHPQHEDGGSFNVALGLRQALGGYAPTPPIVWTEQQGLANRLMDAIGLDAVSDLIGKALEASPHMGGGAAQPEQAAA